MSEGFEDFVAEAVGEDGILSLRHFFPQQGVYPLSAVFSGGVGSNLAYNNPSCYLTVLIERDSSLPSE
ncbi:MAG: hypothetical protein QXW98_08145 [Candidatus Caldarchaeum sp.]